MESNTMNDICGIEINRPSGTLGGGVGIRFPRLKTWAIFTASCRDALFGGASKIL